MPLRLRRNSNQAQEARLVPQAVRALIVLSAATLLLFGRTASAERDRGGSGDDSEVVELTAKNYPMRGYGQPNLRGRRVRPEAPPRTADDARNPDIEEAMRNAPPVPSRQARYRGRDQSTKAVRHIHKLIPTFINFRATIGKATWRVDPLYEWRVRSRPVCLADLRRQHVKVKVWRPEPVEGAQPGTEEEEEDLEPTPTGVSVRSVVGGVHFRSGGGTPILVSCELASRLPAIAEVLSHHDVDQVIVTSSYRPQPRTSFHTMGLALDIPRFHVRTPLRGPDGDVSPWLSVYSDFYGTPDRETCDPANFEKTSPLGDNERGRRLLAIACDLYASGLLSTVITPNYNPGHRDHFHVDIRPDDPRIFLR